MHTRLRILTRSALLIAWVGVLSLFNTGIGLILGFYAAWFALSIPFLKWRPRNLFIAAAVCLLAGTVVKILFTMPFTAEALGIYYGGGTDHAVIEWLITGMYPGNVFMACVLLGLGLSRLDLTAVKVQRLMIVAGVSMAAFGYGTSAVLVHFIAPEIQVTYEQVQSKWTSPGVFS